MKRIYIARDITQAQLMVNLLEQQLVPAKIENAHQSSGLGDLAVSYPEVWLTRACDAERAQSIIDAFEAQAQLPVGNQICANCKESNPVSFDWCWACKADLTDLST